MLLDNATRINAACFTQEIHNVGEVIVEFWTLSGSIVRTTYTRRTTATTYTFIPVASWEYTELTKLIG